MEREALSASLNSAWRFGELRQSPPQIVTQIIHVLNADAKPDQAVTDAAFLANVRWVATARSAFRKWNSRPGKLRDAIFREMFPPG